MNLSELRGALPEATATLVPESQGTPVTCEITRGGGVTEFDMCFNGQSVKVTVPSLLSSEQCAKVVSLMVESLTS